MADPIVQLQHSVGNRAVARLLQRSFYERTADGKLLWHDEEADETFEDTGETAWGWIRSYSVFTRRPEPEPEKPAAKKKRRGPKNKAKPPTAAPGPAIPDVVVPPVPAAPAPVPIPYPTVDADDDAGFAPVKGKNARRADARLAEDPAPLVATVDAHRGDPGAIRDDFSHMVNVLEAHATLTAGTIVGAYQTRAERGTDKFSVEVTIPALRNWVLHAHCTGDGEIAEGRNPIHYKRVSDRFGLGASVDVTARQIRLLMPDAAARLAAATAANLV
jgi:hypothetical protein